jgi:hypothetical protein
MEGKSQADFLAVMEKMLLNRFRRGRGEQFGRFHADIKQGSAFRQPIPARD